MVRLIMGEKGTGKTKKLIEMINTTAQEDNGSVVCVEAKSTMTFDLHYHVRLISAYEYGLSNYDFESAYHAMNSLLARRAEFTALFAMSDVIAFGAIRALVSAGFRVPEDVSAIGIAGPLLLAGDDHHRPARRADRAPEHRAAGAADRAWCPGPEDHPPA